MQVLGESVSNVANRFLSYVEEGESESEAGGRRIRCASSLTNYSDFEAAMELSLYEGERLQKRRIRDPYGQQLRPRAIAGNHRKSGAW